MPQSGLGKLTAMQGASSLYDMYSKNQMAKAQMSRYNQMNDRINNMYAPGSPEYNLMKQTIDRKDAAAGRNSQFGTRAVDLAGTIAKYKMDALNQASGSQNSLYNSAISNQYGGLNSLFGYANQNAKMGQLGDILSKNKQPINVNFASGSNV